MMTNGMKESSDGVAVLEDVDAAIFKLFAEFCYTGQYRLSPKIKRVEECFCVCCGSFTCHRDSLEFPYCSFKCQGGDAERRMRGLQYCIDCGKYTSSTCARCDDCHYLQAAAKTNATIRSSAALEIKFKALEYPVAGLDHKSYRQNLNAAMPSHDHSDHVSSHAKLYIFADTYAVEGLKLLCLHLLHRDLSEFKLEGWNIGEVIEMFRSTYDSTMKQTAEMYGVGEELRKLVMAYAGWHAKTLACCQVFNDLIAEGGDFATDFMRALIEQLQS